MLPMTAEISLPLFSFKSIVDMDMALFKLVMLEYRNDAVFDMDKIKNSRYQDILHDIYYRREENPLVLYVRDEKYREFVDECYHEFVSLHEKEILKYSVTTEILNLVTMFNNTTDITPSIFYYTDEEKKILDGIPSLRKIKKVSLEETKDNIYSSIYLRYIEELEPFKNLTGKTFYFSTTGTNFIEDGEILKIDDDEVKRLFFNQNKISIYDMYRTDIIGR